MCTPNFGEYEGWADRKAYNYESCAFYPCWKNHKLRTFETFIGDLNAHTQAICMKKHNWTS